MPRQSYPPWFDYARQHLVKSTNYQAWCLTEHCTL
jgi:hypothetical protein